jgi:TPP-dependent pyruvate/acetoin dehydrogenase alpha subunit
MPLFTDLRMFLSPRRHRRKTKGIGMAESGTTATSTPPSEALTRAEILLARHADMSRHRALEEALSEGVRDKKLEGLLHLSMGAEAVTAALTSRLGGADRLYSAHRPHGHFLLSGVPARAIVAELAGRETGLCRGRGGTLHLMSDRAVLATGIVGGSLPPAVGHALRLAAGGIVAVCFGDGAVQAGTFHEAMNLAALWHAPVLFVCENNGWAEFTSREEHTTVGGVVRYGDLYGVPALAVDGSDVEAVGAAVDTLIGPMRDGGGPALLECHVARLRPHYEGDWRPHSADGDPLPIVEGVLVQLGADRAELTARRTADLEEMRTLLDDVLASDPFPDPSEDISLVYRVPLS